MGNNVDTGFNMPPQSYLREIRRKTDRHVRDIATSGKRQDSVVAKKKVSGQTAAELTPDSVKDYVISNPSFLDDLITSHISKDRLRAWLRESKDSKCNNNNNNSNSR